MATSRLLLTNGEALTVEGALDDVTKALENAARSSAGTFARLSDADGSAKIAVNPVHVVTVIPGDE
jgi:hypothetical protein